MKQQKFSKTHERIVDLLKEHGVTELHGGVQLFADQHDKEWSISVNFNGTGLHISKEAVDMSDLEGDELIRVYRSWTYQG